MGNICIDKQQPSRSQLPRSASNTFSFIKSNSSHDHQFLGYLDIPKLNQLIRQVLTGLKKPEQIASQIDIFDAEIRYYLNQLKSQGSKINRKLANIQQKISNTPSKGYIIFQIQTIQLIEPTPQIVVEVSTDSSSQPQFKKILKMKQNKTYSTSSLFMQSLISAHYLIIRINQYILTLDISEINNKIFVLQKLNLKNSSEMLTVMGTIVIRLQYIQDTNAWKKQLEDQLIGKLKQVEIIKGGLQKLGRQSEDKQNEGRINTSEMLLRYLEEEESEVKQNQVNVKQSFYDNQFEI